MLMLPLWNSSTIVFACGGSCQISDFRGGALVLYSFIPPQAVFEKSARGRLPYAVLESGVRGIVARM